MASAWAQNWDSSHARSDGFLASSNWAKHNKSLESAVERTQQKGFGSTNQDKEYLANLIRALSAQLSQQVSNQQIQRAWKSLDLLTKVLELDESNGPEELHQHSSRLAEETIQKASSLLEEGKPTAAHSLLANAKQHGFNNETIAPWLSVANEAMTAEKLSKAAKFQPAIDLLSKAYQSQPKMRFLTGYMDRYRQRNEQVKILTDRLRRAMTYQQWSSVSLICRQLLVIAPQYTVAQDAIRRLMDISKNQVNENTVQTNKQESTVASGRATSNTHETEAICGDTTPSIQTEDKKFMLWIDGVGGYLVCPGKTNVVGQAIDETDVQIPILGDLKEHHCKIESFGRDHVIQPMATVSLDGKEVQPDTPLKSQQIIELEGGVNLRYAQPHPLSGSARLEFHSRHRTAPWSDSVLLANGPLILGPNQQNHVHCPDWKSDLIIFQRDGKWFARTDGEFEIDGERISIEGPINLNSRIVASDFTLSLEPLE